MMPSFHIFCAGTGVVPYALLSALCLSKSCPYDLQGQLKIVVHVIGLLNKSVRRRVEREFHRIRGVHVEHDLILLDEHKYRIDRIRKRLIPARLERVLRTKGQSNKIIRSIFGILVGRAGRAHHGLYHHEWINAVCAKWESEESIVVVDSDLFVPDIRMFESSRLSLESDEFGGGWVWRYHDQMEAPSGNFRPFGTELFVLSPRIWGAVNCQKENWDVGAFDRLKAVEANAVFARPYFIDTLCGPCWMANLKGYKTDIRFGDLTVCHPGGVGHLSVAYFDASPAGEDREEWLDLNVRRVRVHYRCQRLIRAAGFADLVDESMFNKIDGLREVILERPELANRWHQLEARSDELALHTVAKLLGLTEFIDSNH